MAAQVGGVGIDAEADEVSFRAQGHRHQDGRLGVLWLRYICFAERGSRHLLLRYLGARFVANAGQGGGGGLSDEELSHAVFCGLLAVFRDGSVVHTDSAQAYISLGQAEPSLEAAPAEVQEAMASAPPQPDGVSFFGAWRRSGTQTSAPPPRLRPTLWSGERQPWRLAMPACAALIQWSATPRSEARKCNSLPSVGFCCTLTWRLLCGRLRQIRSSRTATPGESQAP